jgi:formylglycine-generating enzyme required for sulfatase activity
MDGANKVLIACAVIGLGATVALFSGGGKSGSSSPNSSNSNASPPSNSGPAQQVPAGAPGAAAAPQAAAPTPAQVQAAQAQAAQAAQAQGAQAQAAQAAQAQAMAAQRQAPQPQAQVPPRAPPQAPQAQAPAGNGQQPDFSNATGNDVEKLRAEILQRDQLMQRMPATPQRSQAMMQWRQAYQMGDRLAQLGNFPQACDTFYALNAQMADYQAGAIAAKSLQDARAAAATARAGAQRASASDRAADQWKQAEARNAAAEQAAAGAGADAKALVAAATAFKQAGQDYETARAAAVHVDVVALVGKAREQDQRNNPLGARDFLAQAMKLDPNDADAKALAKALEAQLYTTNSIGMRLSHIGPGQVLMGSPIGDPGRSPDEVQRLVHMTRGYWIGTTPVTQGQFAAVMTYNPSVLKGDDLPATNISWAQASEFCRKLSATEKRTYHLPTEAQFEYALRAGSDTAVPGGRRLDEVAWFRDNSGGKPHPVATKAPNAWGLYDVQGNVYQWCSDFTPRFSADDQTDPVGPAPRGLADRSPATLRGGAFDCDANRCRASSRFHWMRGEQGSPNMGFRVVMDE